MPRSNAQDILTRSSNSSCLTHCELAVYVQTVGKLSATDPCSFYWKLICGVLLLADEHIAWTCTVGDEMSSSAAGSTYIAYNDSRVLCSCSAVFDPFSRAQVCDAAGTEMHTHETHIISAQVLPAVVTLRCCACGLRCWSVRGSRCCTCGVRC